MAVFTFSCSARFIAMTQASPEVTENNFRSRKKPLGTLEVLLLESTSLLL